MNSTPQLVQIFVLSVGGLVLAWGIGAVLARWGRGPALIGRALALMAAGVCGLVYFALLHGPRVHVLLVPAVVYPLLANEQDRAQTMRVLVLGELLVVVLGEALDVVQWRFGLQQLQGFQGLLAVAMLIGVPGMAVWMRARLAREGNAGIIDAAEQ